MKKLKLVYVNIKLKFVENYLLDRDFVNIDRVLPLVKEVQVLKNNYITREISLKFQSNYINEQINKGLKNYERLDEIENNLKKTLELTKYNTDILFSVVVGVITVGSMLLSADDISKMYHEHPYITLGVLFVILIFVAKAASNKAYFIKKIKNIFKRINRLIGL